MSEQFNINDNVILQEIAMSISEVFSKIYKPSCYKEVILNLMHNYYWKNVIGKELHNLDF